MLTRATAAIARWTVRWWWVVLLGWVAVLGALLAWAPPFSTVATYDEGAFLSDDAPAIEGGRLLTGGWPDDSFTGNGAVVLARDGGPLTDADRRYARRLADWFSSPDAPAAFGDVTTHLRDRALASSLVADDERAMFLLVGLTVAPFSPPANQAVEVAREHIDASAPPEGLDVLLTGTAGIAADEAAAIETSVTRTHLITIVLVIAILLWVYRSPVAPIVPLTTIGVSYGVSLSVVSLLARAGMTVSSLYETFAIVIIFGAGTDYCLFLISRFHEELQLGERSGLASRERLRPGTLTATVLVLAAVIGSSAMTTVAGFSAQAVSDFGMYRSMGPAMAVSVAITLLAAVTLAPALMHLLGRRLFWPDRGVRGGHGGGDTPLVVRHAEHLSAADRPHATGRDGRGDGPESGPGDGAVETRRAGTLS